MANTVYDNFVLSNEIEDQYNSHLDLQTFCTVDNSLVGTAGMLRKVNVYKATDGTEKLAMGRGNTKSIEVGFTPREYRILLAQNRFKYYDEQAMTDPQLVPVGTKHMGTDMFNTVNADIYAEFAKATQVVVVTEFELRRLRRRAVRPGSGGPGGRKHFRFRLADRRRRAAQEAEGLPSSMWRPSRRTVISGPSPA